MTLEGCSRTVRYHRNIVASAQLDDFGDFICASGKNYYIRRKSRMAGKVLAVLFPHTVTRR